MFKFLSPESLARFSAKHPWYMVGLWALILVGAFMGAGMAKTDNASESGNTEAQRAFNALERARGEAVPEETIVITSASESVDSPAYRDFVTNLAAKYAVSKASKAPLPTTRRTTRPWCRATGRAR